MNNAENQTTGGGILNINFSDKEGLYAAYMPFVSNGGLFIPTLKEFSLGYELFVALGLPNDGEKLPVSCRVVWITPAEAQGNRTPGIGVQFKDNGIAKSTIEVILGGLLKSEKSTRTM